MRAFVKYEHKPYAAELRTVDIPRPGKGEVLVKVAACGICGSDLHAYRGAPGYEWVTPPLILGHEFSGTVCETGPETSRFGVGNRVAVIGIQGCGACWDCCAGRTNLCRRRRVIGLSMDGGMAEYVLVNEKDLLPIPQEVDLKQAALVEPLSVAAHALAKARPYPGLKTVVTGPGPIGLFCALISRHSGAPTLLVGTEQDSGTRLPVAERLGLSTLTLTQDETEADSSSFFQGGPPDLWVEASGSPQALDLALRSVGRGGSLIVVGMYEAASTWQPTQSVRAEHSLFFSYASTCSDYRFAFDFMVDGQMNTDSIATCYSLKNAGSAFNAAIKGQTVKPLLIP
ncbi:MAG: alcohol dehydrogenase catalytic domain-containing protein [Desulfohalobiaceae bacterium]|nr:alcohol dehydrogenase catalytic domain-containing protein [Desulfohalobiaceae bacterium]